MKTHTNSQVRHLVAYVGNFDTSPGKKKGFALVQGDPHEFVLTAESGPKFIIAGKQSPAFHPDRRATRIPCPGDEIILRVSGTGGDQKVIAWGFNEFWQQAQKFIDAQPKPAPKLHINHLTVFRILRQTKVNGKIVGTEGSTQAVGASKEETAFTGTLQQMLAVSQRDGLRTSTVDKFAPTYVAPGKLGIIVYNRFQVRDHKGAWIDWRDPRAFPLGTVYQLVLVRGKSREVLMTGTALEIAWKYPRDERDPLRKYASSGGHQGYVEWFRREPDGRTTREISIETGKPVQQGIVAKWTECRDPRPDEVAAKKPVTVRTATSASSAPIAQKDVAQKPAAAKPLRTVVANSLDNLHLAIVPQ
ncbi:MAG: hypothetical protein AAB365_01995 [Patescibacteria group bacterium]